MINQKQTLNLQKKEMITSDALSKSDYTEEERLYERGLLYHIKELEDAQ